MVGEGRGRWRGRRGATFRRREREEVEGRTVQEREELWWEREGERRREEEDETQ